MFINLFLNCNILQDCFMIYQRLPVHPYVEVNSTTEGTTLDRRAHVLYISTYCTYIVDVVDDQFSAEGELGSRLDTSDDFLPCC